MQDLHDLELLLASPVALILVETHEEQRVMSLLTRLAVTVGTPMFHWTVTQGLRRLAIDFEPQLHTREPTELLAQIKATRSAGIYVLSDFHPYLGDPVHVRYLKDIAINSHEVAHTVLMVSHEMAVPPELERLCARFELSMPDRDKVRRLVLEEARLWSQRTREGNVRTSRRMLDRLVENLLGLPATDVVRLARGAIEDDGAITDEDMPKVMQAKFDAMSRDGVLTFECDTARFAEVGGLARLKEWLALREPVFTGRLQRPGLDRPKGVMLLGVQGCGKSLAAKAVAGAWGVPLLRLDFGTLYNKYHGESEKNLRESLRQAQTMEPCVLWIDEIEKGLAVDDGESGTSRRILGTLLTWMAENRERVFIVATANDIQSLPPELLRKGRVDEIFFVDLPDAGTRRIILGIHLAKREIDPAAVDLDRACAHSEGFSGAEIEQAVVSTLYTAFARDEPFSTALLIEELGRTRPLSVVMGERIAELRAWAAERTVPAN